jgi:hypothetical protein
VIAGFDDGEKTQELPKVPRGLWAPPPQIRARRDLRVIAIVLGAVAVIAWATLIGTGGLS